jgi:LPXTG-motif cell wall-anchored protein
MTMTIVAIVIGVAVGATLALLAGLALRRRRRDPGAARARAGTQARRPSILGTPAQRLRALWMAVAIAAGALMVAAAGAEVLAGPLLLLALMLAGQSALFGLIDRLRARRR